MSALSNDVKDLIENNSVLYVVGGGSKVLFDKETGCVSYTDDIPKGEPVLNVDMVSITDNDLCYAILSGDEYVFHVWRGKGGHPAYEDTFDKCAYDMTDGPELCGILSNHKFLGIGTYAEGESNLLGSSMYLEWKGDHYECAAGRLDRWIAGEEDDEYELTEDGENIVMKPRPVV